MNRIVKKKVLAICGSIRKDSSNLHILHAIRNLTVDSLDIEMYNELEQLPHFNPDNDKDKAPEVVDEFRKKLKAADGIIICTPEYVFSLPAVLKNAIEWTVSTTIFSEKPVAIITASGLGEKAHESLLLIMKTVYASIPEGSQLLIKGARTKVTSNGEITDSKTLKEIEALIASFTATINY